MLRLVALVRQDKAVSSFRILVPIEFMCFRILIPACLSNKLLFMACIAHTRPNNAYISTLTQVNMVARSRGIAHMEEPI